MFWVMGFLTLYALCALEDWLVNRSRKKAARERTAAERALDLIAADYEPRRGPEREEKKKKTKPR